jgi:hypothetical protein
MEVAGLILGIIGTVTGIAALAWEVVIWRRSGPVVTVGVTQGLPTYGDHLGDLTSHPEREGADRGAAGEPAGCLGGTGCQPGAERVKRRRPPRRPAG